MNSSSLNTQTEALKLALEALKPVSTYGRVGSRDTDTAKAQQAITAIRKALASQPAQQQEQGRQIDQLIKERDHRDEIIDKLCDAVLGPDRYEWSSQYFFEDAVREVEERMAALEQPAQQQGWKLVPIDANDTMIDAFENFIGRDISGFRQAYQAMLNAAPQPAHQEPDLSWLKPETQKKIRQWLADGSFAERAIGVIDAQEKALMRYEAQQQEHEQQHTRDAETELNCAEEVLDGYAAHLEHQDTAFNRIGDYLKEVCEALKERPPQQEHLEHTSVRRSGPQM